MSAHDDVSDVVDNASKLQASWFTRKMLVLKELTVRYEVSGVSDDEHVANVSVTGRENQLLFVLIFH